MKVVLVLLLFFLFSVPVSAQINHVSHSKHEQELRQSLKEAAKVDALYKETHLNTDTYTFRKGVAGRKVSKREGAEKSKKLTLSEKLKNLFQKKKYKQLKTETDI
ncbi:hypothetical protein CLV24_10313 [Pontibacter ummariensis]|uniref:Uncharacterized protein n=1 Tax=Pontibacter ummariensis TaxID=1610492 RepID=A0A239CXA2_9BACT|nr:hypothetical protein [Pontibacter ummariensis]PRY14776.1 hypothetical protein CLV24_10313 [Pontibacter ummariensis]SNS24687.1 hypothetical protein SAMN06296052_103300 [Pontibacter ummariensis]